MTPPPPPPPRPPPGVQTAWSKTLIRRDHSSSKLAPHSILIKHPKTRYDQLHIPIMPKWLHIPNKFVLTL